MSGKERHGALLIPQIHQVSGRIFSRLLRNFKMGTLSPAQSRILLALWIGDDIPIQELALRTSLKKSTLTAMLDGLENSGYIKRFPSETDRRKVHIRLTQENKGYKHIYESAADRMIEIGYRGLSKGEIEKLEDILSRILENLKNAERTIEAVSKPSPWNSVSPEET